MYCGTRNHGPQMDECSFMVEWQHPDQHWQACLCWQGKTGICHCGPFEVPAMPQIATLPWHAPCSCFHSVLAPLMVWMLSATLHAQPTWSTAVGGSQLPALVPSPIPALQQQTDRPVSPEAEGLWGLLSSTLSKMKIIASRKMHPFSFTNPWCGNVLTFNEVHLCISANSKGFTEKRRWCSLLLPPPVLSLT